MIENLGFDTWFENKIDPDKTEDFQIARVIAVNRDNYIIRNELSEFIGSGKYATAEYEKIKRFTFPLNHSYFLYITTEPEINSCTFVDGVLNLKDSFW